MVCPPSPKGLVSPCLPLSSLWMVCPPSRGSCLPFSPPVPLLVSLCWMVCPPSRGSSLPFCLPLCPFLFPFVGCPPSRGSCLPLCPLVSPCLTLSHFLFPKQCAVRGSQCFLKVSALVLDGVSTFPFVGWCVRLPEGLVSPCVPLSPLVSPCLTSYSPSSVLLGVLNAFLRCPPWCWMVYLPSRGSCLPLCQLLFPFVGWCVRLPEGLVSPCLPLSALLSPLVSNCTPFCFPLLDVPLPEGLVSPCLPLSPFLFPKQCTVRGS